MAGKLKKTKKRKPRKRVAKRPARKKSTRKKTTRRKVGRPKKRFSASDKKLALYLLANSVTREEVRSALACNRQRLAVLLAGEEFREAIKKGEHLVLDRLVGALVQRGLGYEYEETTITNCSEHGRKVVTHHKQMAPDVGAIAYYTKNKDPKNWKDRHDLHVDADENVASMLGKLADAEAKGSV